MDLRPGPPGRSPTLDPTYPPAARRRCYVGSRVRGWSQAGSVTVAGSLAGEGTVTVASRRIGTMRTALRDLQQPVGHTLPPNGSRLPDGLARRVHNPATGSPSAVQDQRPASW